MEYRKGDILCSGGISNDYVIYILEGEARYLFSTLNYPKTMCRATTGNCIGLINLISSTKIESAIASTKINAIILDNSTISNLVREGLNLSTPTTPYSTNPVEQEYLLSQFVSENVLIEYTKHFNNYKSGSFDKANCAKFRYNFFKGIARGEWLVDDADDDASISKFSRVIDIDFNVLQAISEKLPNEKALSAAEFKRQALLSFIKIINKKQEDVFQAKSIQKNKESKEQDYSIKDQICFVGKELDLQYSDDALKYACNQIVMLGKEYDLDCICDLLFSIGINAVPLVLRDIAFLA